MNKDSTWSPVVDEYLWPLTGDDTKVDWRALAEEMQVRERLSAISTHVHETHVAPRLRRMGLGATHAARTAVIDGPNDGAPWEKRLKAPVPAALRDEWARLAQRLRLLSDKRNRS
jgi:hypothetical protein